MFSYLLFYFCTFHSRKSTIFHWQRWSTWIKANILEDICQRSYFVFELVCWSSWRMLKTKNTSNSAQLEVSLFVWMCDLWFYCLFLDTSRAGLYYLLFSLSFYTIKKYLSTIFYKFLKNFLKRKRLSTKWQSLSFLSETIPLQSIRCCNAVSFQG